jgi:hypothetical protein
MRKAILIPCSPLQSCQQIALPNEPYHLGRLAELVGGDPERAQYDLDTALYVDGNGPALGRARNEHATRYALVHSGAASRRGVDPGTPTGDLPYFLYGDVVLVGETDDGSLADVPERFLEPGYLGWSFERTPFDPPSPADLAGLEYPARTALKWCRAPRLLMAAGFGAGIRAARAAGTAGCGWT